MKKTQCLPARLLLSLVLTFQTTVSFGQTTWYDAANLELTGQAWSELEHPYDRLPAKAKGVVRDPVWNLATHTAGMQVHFQTNSPDIRIKWAVRYETHMWHMTDCGTRGVDLYMLDGERWRYAGSGKPGGGKLYEETLVSRLDGQIHQFVLNLPLYDGIDSLMIGVEEGSVFLPSQPFSGKPVVIYGTSIQQGGCASRPGMAPSNILSRMLNREVINLGFSGNGRMEMELAELIAEIDASVYVFDCLPNLHDIDSIASRYVQFVRYIRQQRPHTPMVLVETATTVKAAILEPARMHLNRQNEALRTAYQTLRDEGMTHLYLVPGEGLIGYDQEATVDGVHYTDLGFMRYAERVVQYVRDVM